MICPVTLRSSLYQSNTTFEANCSWVLPKGHSRKGHPSNHPCHHRIINPHIDLEMCDRRILWSQWCLPIDVQNFEMPSYEFNLTQECYASKRVHQFSLALYFHWCKSEWRKGVLYTLCVPQVFLAISICRSMLIIVCPMMGWNGRNVGLKRLIVASFVRYNLYYVRKMPGLLYGTGVSNFL